MSLDLPDLTQQPIEHVDATPDADYPLRILRAHRSNCDCHYEVHGLDEAHQRFWGEMNKTQERRAKLLDEAIAVLEAARGKGTNDEAR